MSDEEDTAILLGGERTSTEKEIKLNPAQETYQTITQNNITSHLQLTLSSVAVFTSGICFGYDLGIIGNLINSISSTLNLTCTEQYYIISIWLLGAILSGIFGGFIIDICGRKWSIVCSTMLVIFSSVLSSLTQPYALLLCSRFLSGFSGPLLTISQSIYTSETSNPKFRGFRICLHYMGSALGSLLTCIASLYVGHDSRNWRLALSFSSIPAFITLVITLIWLPTSPHFKLYQRTQNVNKRTSNNRVSILVETFVVAVFLIIFQQLSGRYTVFFYAPRLFSLLGICASQAAFIAIITFSIVKFLSTFLCLCIVDRLGRRTSLIMSSTIMMTSIAFLALLSSIDNSDHTYTNLHHDNCHGIALPDSMSFLPAPQSDWHVKAPLALPKSPPPFPMLPTPLSLISPNMDNCLESETTSNLMPALRIVAVVTLLLYEAAYALGFGTLSWVLLSEIFPASVRGRGMCAVICLRWLTDFIVPTTFIKLGSTLSSTFLIYGFICMLSILFTFFMVPETKSKTLHQIAQEIRNVSLATRIFQNLHALPFFTTNEWLEQRSHQYRQQSRPAVESTII